MKRTINLFMVMMLIFSLFAPSISAEGINTSNQTQEGQATDIDLDELQESDSEITITSTDESEEPPTDSDVEEPSDVEAAESDTDAEDPVSETDTDSETESDDEASEEATEEEEEPVTEDEEAQEETDANEEEAIEDEEENTEEAEAKEGYDIDKSNEVKKGGVHVSIRYSDFNGSASYIPSFTLMLATTEGQVISTVKAGPQNYDREHFEYNLVFKHPGYKKGEEYLLYLPEADHTVEGVEMILQYFDENDDLVTEKATVKVGNYYKFGVREVEYIDGEEEDKKVLDLSPSSFAPLTGHLLTKKNKVGFVLVNKQGAPLKNQKVTLRFQDDRELNLTSDNQGVAWTTNGNLRSTVFEFIAEGKRVAGDEFNSRKMHHFDSDIQDSLVTYLVVLEDRPNEANVTSFDIKTKVDGNTELSNNWVNADLIFKSNKGEEIIVSINHLDTKVALMNGTYTVTARSDYANVKLSSNTVTVKDGKGSLTATLSPKYILEVDKDGADFSFTVINVASIMDKEFKGTNKVSFGVTPNESYMIRDNADDQVFTVVIDEGSTLTRLILGVGVVVGGQYDAPHTGDNLIFLILLFIVFTLASGVSYYYFKTNKRVRNATVSLLLIAILLISFIPENIAQANTSSGGTTIDFIMPGGETVGSGTPTKPGGSKLTPKGFVQTHETLSLLMVSFTSGFSSYGGRLLDADSNLSELRNPFKFSPNRMRNAFFMAPNQTAYNEFKKSSSSFALFNENTEGLVTLFGSNPFTDNTEASAKANRVALGLQGNQKLSDRLLPLSQNAKKNNYYEQFVATMMDRVGPVHADRQLWKGRKSNSKMNTGDAISREYINNYYNRMNSDNENIQAEAAIGNDTILESYLQRLKNIGEHQVVKELTANYEVNTTEHIFLFQVVQAFYVTGEHGRYMFMPMSEAVKWFDHYAKKGNNTYKNKKIRNTDQAKVIYNGSRGTGADSNWGKIAPTFTYVGNTEATTGVAMKPKTSKVPIPSGSTTTASALNINPFTGWGYINWGYDGSKTDEGFGQTPSLRANLVIHEVDDDMQQTGKTTRVPLPLTEGGSTTGEPLVNLNTREQIISGPMTVKTKDFIYIIQPQEAGRLTLTDEKDKESLLKVDPTYNGGVDDNFWGLRTKVKGDSQSTIPVPTQVGDDKWRIYYELDIPEPLRMYRYLGGPETDDDGNTIVSEQILSTTDNKYAGKKNANGKDEFSNALLELHVTAYPIPNPDCETNCTDPTPITSMLSVPEWRLTEYFPDISPKAKAKAVFHLNIPASTWRNPKLSPSGLTTFNLVDPKLGNVPWAMSKAKLFNDSPLRTITAHSSAAQFNLAGDLLAIKDNSSVMNSKMASWKNNYALLGNRIGVTAKGEPENKPKVMKSHTFKYGVKSPHSSYTYSETRRACGGSGENYSCWNYTWSGNASQSYVDTYYNTIVEFNRYVPKASVENKQFGKKDDKDTNGFYWETYQDSKKLNVNPEVLMAHDDTNGNTSVVFTAGDQMRQIQPVHYNVAKYVNVDIKPQVDGMSVATDTKARQLASSLGGNGLGVTYKGSSITNTFEVDGELELKTYALDIGSTSLKNTWGNSTYSTDAVNEEFLSRYATKREDGTWEVDLNADGKMKINSKEYGGQKDSYKIPQKSKNVKEHTLVVRGGNLLSVNGNKNLGSLDKDLKDALARMSISTAVGNNVFNTFEREKGASLSESHIATLGNAMRGNSDLAKDKRWYNEDTTVMVVREYTNVFDLPQHMYVDKIPMEIDQHLKVPVDKNQFFSKGYLGYTKLRFHLVDGWMEYDSSELTPFGGLHESLFVVPNVSVLDSFNQ